MQITSLLSRYLDTSGIRHGAEAIGQAVLPQAEKPVAEESPSGQDSAAVRQILSQYDVTSISPRQFSEMLQKLHQSGAITDQQFQDFSQVRSELDQAGVEPDEKTDLVRFYTKRLDQARDSGKEALDKTGTLPAGQTAMISSIEQRLQWLQKVATIQADPAAGVNSTV